MTRRLRVIGAVGATLALTLAVSSIAFATPLYGRPLVAPRPVKTGPTPDSSNTASGVSSAAFDATGMGSSTTAESARPNQSNSAQGSGTTTTTGNVQEHLKPNQLQPCEERIGVINEIMSRANTRAQNQIKLFTTVATNVEGFYASRGKTIGTYSQLVATVNADETQANSDLTALNVVSGFDCTGNNPVGIVSTYRSALAAVQTDSMNLRTAIKDLISGVAQAEGFTLSGPNAKNGGQQ
jgi:hypothetical protein